MHKFLKTTPILTIALLSAAPGFAQTPTSSLPGLFACRSIEDDQARVQCYDKVTDDLAAADQKGEIVTITKKQVEDMEKESFGFNLPSIPKLSSLFGEPKPKDGTVSNGPQEKVKKKSAQNLIAPIKSVRLFNRNKTRFFLENGQIWEQTGGRTLRLRIRDGRPTVAHIYKGTLSGYRLRVNGKGTMITVRRIK